MCPRRTRTKALPEKSAPDIDWASIRRDYPFVRTETVCKSKGETTVDLMVPHKMAAWVRLVLPRGFPDTGRAIVRLSQDAVLRIPHVGDDGKLCLADEDPGPRRGLRPEVSCSCMTGYTATRSP